MSNDIKFKTRDRGKVVIAEYRGVSEGATLCWWQKDDSLVVWDIARWMDWEGTIRGHYFKLDGTQNLAAILDHPTDHNAQALHDAKLELAKRMHECEDITSAIQLDKGYEPLDDEPVDDEALAKAEDYNYYDSVATARLEGWEEE